jgi:hypothetical protein
MHTLFWRKSLACTFHGAFIHFKHATLRAILHGAFTIQGTLRAISSQRNQMTIIQGINQPTMGKTIKMNKFGSPN